VRERRAKGATIHSGFPVEVHLLTLSAVTLDEAVALSTAVRPTTRDNTGGGVLVRISVWKQGHPATIEARTLSENGVHCIDAPLIFRSMIAGEEAPSDHIQPPWRQHVPLVHQQVQCLRGAFDVVRCASLCISWRISPLVILVCLLQWRVKLLCRLLLNNQLESLPVYWKGGFMKVVGSFLLLLVLIVVVLLETLVVAALCHGIEGNLLYYGRKLRQIEVIQQVIERDGKQNVARKTRRHELSYPGRCRCSRSSSGIERLQLG